MQQQNQQPQPINSLHADAPQGSHKTDTLGIVSLIMIAIMPIAGFVIGIIGMNHAKRDGYPDTLSKIGAIVNGILTVGGILIFMLWIAFLVLFAASVDDINSGIAEPSTQSESSELQLEFN